MSDLLYLFYKAGRRTRSWILRHRLWTFLIGLVLVGVLSYKPALKKWRQVEAHENAARAMELIKLGKWSDAAPLLVDAYKTNPDDPTIVRACIYYERNGSKKPAMIAHFLRQMVLLGHADSEDKALLSQALLEQGLLKDAQSFFESIPAQDRNMAGVLEAESLFMRKKGDNQVADELLRKALSMKPDEPMNQLKLALLDLNSHKEELRQQSLKSLWELARSAFHVSYEAIEKLALHPGLTAPQSEELLELVSHKEGATETLHYEVVSCHLRLHPQLRESLIDLQVARSATGSDEKFLYLCVWLVFENEYDRLLKHLPQDKAVRDAKLFPIYAEALARQGKWAELSEFLKTKNLPSIPLDLALRRARCAHELKEAPSVVREYLIAAQVHALAPKNPKALQRIADLAEKLMSQDIAVDCLLGMHSQSSPLSETVVEHILELQRGQGDLAGMITTLRVTNISQRGTIALAESSIYLKILSGVELETVMDECDRLTAQGTISANSHEFFKAFAAYRNGDVEVVKAAVDRINPASFPPGWRAIYAGILSSTGEQARAYQIAEKIETALIMEQERKLLAKAL